MFKNSEMLFQAILNEPKNQDVYRAYADALIEEGQEEKGNFIANNLGKSFEANTRSCKTPDGTRIPNIKSLCAIHSSAHWTLYMENGLVAGLKMPFSNFWHLSQKNLFRRNPLRSIHIMDRTPLVPALNQSHTMAFWTEGSEDRHSLYYLYSSDYLLPEQITKHFSATSKVEPGRAISKTLFAKRFYFAGVKKALQALSDACVKMGREEAGLIVLPENGYRQLEL